MNNSPLNLNSIRQPAPDVTSSVQTTTAERKFNVPNVGVVSVPSISKTPILDTLEIKKQENPRTAYKLTSKSNKGFNLQTNLSLAIVGCSIGALLKELKKV